MSAAGECQICGRPIKTPKGLIVHHGYRQPHRFHGGPGSGWRTGSCLGTHFRPYEESNDRIPYVIGIIAKQLAADEKSLADLVANPPATLRYDKAQRSWTRGYVAPEWVEVPKPDDVGDADSIEKSFRRYTPHSYEQLYTIETSRLRREIDRGRHDHKHFTTRFESWRAKVSA